MLNEHQRRRLSVRLGRLVAEGEALLADLEAAAGGEAAKAGIGPERLAALRGEVHALLEAAREAAVELDITLGGASPDLAHRVQAWSAAWWTRILDCAPERLGGLGLVDPEDERAIGRAVDGVAAHLARLQRVSAGSS